MKISINSSGRLKKVSAAFVVLGLFLFAAAVVNADSVPVVTTVIQDSSNAVTTSGVTGLVVHDSATVASSTDSSASSTPTGTVDFGLFPNTTCSGTATVESGVALASGMAQSATTTLPSTGLSYMATYDGQAGVYSSASSPCEPLMVTPAVGTATISTALSATTTVASSTVFDTATLSGATADASGTVAYNVFNDSACSVSATGAGTVSVMNDVVPNSQSVLFPAAGTFYWQAAYSGDINNSPATSTCQDEVLTVTSATSTGTGTTTPGQGSVSGTVYNDLNSNGVKDAGEPVLSGWTINLYSGAGFSGSGNNTPIMSTVTDANGMYSFSNLADGIYSIEEIDQSGFTQFTSDYDSVAVTNGAAITGEDFGNVVGSVPNNNPDKVDHGRDNHQFFFKADEHAQNNGNFGRGVSDNGDHHFDRTNGADHSHGK